MSDTSPVTVITGGSGFIGAAVARELAGADHHVVIADVRPMTEEGEFILGDHLYSAEVLRMPVDSEAVVMDEIRDRRPDFIVHLAAVANPLVLERDPLTALRVNVEGTINLLEAARQSEVRRFVYFSSIGVLPSVQYEPIDTNHPTILATEGPGSGFYGASKLAGEAFALSYASAFGLDVRIIRPSAVYGLGMNWPIFIKPMVEGAVRGDAVRLDSGGRFPRDYTHVQDVAGLTRLLLTGPDDADRVFFGATGEPLVTAGEVAEIVRDIVPRADIEIADRLSAADELELGFRGRMSIENARRQLGWEPSYRSLRDGVRRYVDDLRAFLKTRPGGESTRD